MAPPRLVAGILLVLAVLALLPAAVAANAAGTALRRPTFDALPPAVSVDVDNENMSTPRRMEAQEYMETMLSPPPMYCYTEPSFDFVGNDIGNAPASSPTQCCSLCYLRYMCKAWSWSTFNGGTCWLKSQRGAVVYKPGVHSALLFYTPQPTCTLRPNTDYVANDLARVSSSSADGCCTLCKNYPGCRAFSWNGFGGGSCWLKSAKGTVVSSVNVVSAEVYPDPNPIIVDPPPTCEGLKHGVDFADNDIGNAPSPTADGCCAICKGWRRPSACRAFSWTSHNGGTCWLKSHTGAHVPNPSVISATVFEDPPIPCTIQYSVDYIDHDIANRPAANVFTCCNICKAHPGGACKAFSWNNFNGGTCWLKSAQGPVVGNGDVHSGIVI